MINIVPHVQPLLVDTITISVDIPKNQQPQTETKIHAFAESYGSYKTFTPFYTCSYRLYLDDPYGNSTPLTIQCHPTPKDPFQKIRFLRVEWHPSKASAAVVKSILNEIVPGGFKTLLGGTITRVDLAADCKYVRPEHLQWDYPNVQCSRNYLKNGKIQSAYLGTNDSPKQVVIYDKHAQLAEKSKAMKNKPPIPSYALTRVEMRLRMDLTFPDLLTMENPFQKLGLTVSMKPKPFTYDDEYRLFERVCIWEGVPQALKEIHDATKRKKFKAKVMAKELQFWNPGKVWEGLPNALKVAGFPVDGLPSAANPGG